MVVGNGMLAREFASFAENDNVVIFASGVSNSQEQNPAAFAREIELLLSFKGKGKKLIYFSTISVYDQELTNTPYIKHKRLIESLIPKEFKNYIIFRLPQLVGKTENPNTLCNYLYNKITAGETITVFENACRYLMDVSDVFELLSPIITSDMLDKSTINVNFNNKISIDELLDIFETILTRKIPRLHVSKGGCYEPDNNIFNSILQNSKYITKLNYNYLIIEKYYKLHLNH